MTSIYIRPIMNKKVILVKRPKGPIKDTDFKVVSELLDTVLKQGEVLIRVEWLSIDPAQRGI
jgi:NADPH-dependent curcumin reductase CurA